MNHKIPKIILASKSPRRQELLRLMDIDFRIVLKDVDVLRSQRFGNRLEPRSGTEQSRPIPAVRVMNGQRLPGEHGANGSERNRETECLLGSPSVPGQV